MSEESAFLAAIIANPEEDTPRLAFADWLDEHGDSDRAAFIRLQLRQAQLELTPEPLPFWAKYWSRVRERSPEEQAEFDESMHRTHHLFDANRDRWLADIPAPLRRHVSFYHFERGFLGEVDAPAAKVARLTKRAWARHPIRELTLREVPGRLGAVLAMPALSRITELRLHAGRLDASDLDAFAACPHLTGVRELALHAHTGNGLAAAVARCPSLRGVNFLYLDDNVNDAGVADLTATGVANLSQVKRFVVRSDAIGPDGAGTLARTPALAALEYLGLDGDCSIGDAGAAALAKSAHLGGLRSLMLSQKAVGPRSARALAKSQRLTGLRFLNLSFNPLGAAGARALATGSWAELTELDLWSCGLGDEGAAAIASAPALAGLTALDLQGNGITATGAIALSRSTALRELVSLDLRDNPIGDAGARALCKSKALKKLQKLSVELPEGELSPAVTAALKERFEEVD